jgi:hypothetical protein
VIYEDNIYANPKNPVNIGSDSEQSKQCWKRRTVRGVGHNWGKYFIGLFHVSEHLGHLKSIKKKGKKGNCLVGG